MQSGAGDNFLMQRSAARCELIDDQNQNSSWFSIARTTTIPPASVCFLLRLYLLCV